MSMPNFSYVRIKSLKEATHHLSSEGARVHAGGTDLLGCLGDHVFGATKLVSIIGLKNLRGIQETKEGALRIGALLERTRDGYFLVGTNFPVSPKLAAEETKFRLDDPSLSANARRVRADEILKAGEGQVDVALAKRYLSDHYDSYEKKEDAPSERSLCGHVDLSPRGMGDWFAPWGPAGTVQSKVADAALAKRMALEAAMGHPCGTETYRALPHLAKHPEHAWAKPLMRDLVASPWTLFEAL